MGLGSAKAMGRSASSRRASGAVAKWPMTGEAMVAGTASAMGLGSVKAMGLGKAKAMSLGSAKAMGRSASGRRASGAVEHAQRRK